MRKKAVNMAQPDSKKVFFENLTGAGKAIAVLTSGGDAQGTVTRVNESVCCVGDIASVSTGPSTHRGQRRRVLTA